MRQRLPAIGLAIVLIIVLALIATGAINDLVVLPLLYLWWVLGVIYQSLPQVLVWGVFVAIGLLLVARSLAWEAAPQLAQPPPPGQRGRVAAWSGLLRDSSRDDHGRWRLAQRFSQLAIEALAYREQSSAQTISRRLSEGTLDIPPELRDYLRAGLGLYMPRPRLRRFFWQAHGPDEPAEPLAMDLERLMTFLEDALQGTIGDAR